LKTSKKSESVLEKLNANTIEIEPFPHIEHVLISNFLLVLCSNRVTSLHFLYSGYS